MARNVTPASRAVVAAAVVGVGSLGKFHAEKYAASPKCQLMAVVDIDEARAREVGESVGAPPLTDYHNLIGQVQCVSVAVPTSSMWR